MIETGSNTGVFTGEIALTGFPHDADGDPETGDADGSDTDPKTGPEVDGGPEDGFLESQHVDELSVSFKVDTDETVSSSVPILWNMGEMGWLTPINELGKFGIVQVSDPDMNLDPKQTDYFQIDVWSDSDAGGIDLLVTETDVDSGIFEGSISFTVTDESAGTRLNVASGDTLTAEYKDHTPPLPHNFNDELEIHANAIFRFSLLGQVPINGYSRN